jgi:cytochrome c553
MHRWLKISGIVVGVLAVAVAVTAVVVYVATERRMHRTYAGPEASLVVPSDSATVAWGHHIVETRGCTDCHGPNLGGGNVIDEPVIARIWAPNLTTGEGGVGRDLAPADWERAIRRGVAKGGRPLKIMPSLEYNSLSDSDLVAAIAYLRTVPPVNNTVPVNRTGPLGRLLFFLRKIPLLAAESIDQNVTSHTAPTPGPTAEYGRYLATGCTGCHGVHFSGGPIPGMPPDAKPAANLTPDTTTGIGTWSEADFFTALREGRRPDGTALSDEMPWRVTSKLTDDEIRAVYLYLKTVEARPAGGR